MSKEITLACTNKKTIVDDDLYAWLSRWEWRLINSGYAARNFQVNGVKSGVLMHRAILQVHDARTRVDHIDGNRLNNQIDNLRIATPSQNGYNYPSWGGASAYKGVYWNQRRKKWVAKIKVNRRDWQLGSFDDEIMAAKTYDMAARFYGQEFAFTNFPGQMSLSVDEIRTCIKQGILEALLDE